MLQGLDEHPGSKFSDYSALAISMNKLSHNYNAFIVKSKQVTGDFFSGISQFMCTSQKQCLG